MAEFEPITTQEAFDAAVADRLAPFADYDDLKAQNADYASRIHIFEMSELKTRIAHEVGIPFDLSQRLTGENELKPQTPKSPPRSTEPAGGSSRRDALRAFTNDLMSKGE